jgi:uncharacterized protein (TIGR02099 family)
MRHLLMSGVAWIRRGLIVGLLALAALLLLVRALLPLADMLGDELAMQLGARLEMRVQVGSLRVRLEGWSPRITLKRVTLSDRLNDQAELSAGELRLDLNLLASWRARRLRIDGLTLVGAEIELQRDPEGQLVISGLQALGGGQDPGALAFFLREGRFALLDSRLFWTDVVAGLPPLALDIKQLWLRNHRQEHHLRLLAHFAGKAGADLQVLARLHGASDDLAHWTGPVYAQLTSPGDLAALFSRRWPAVQRLNLVGTQLESWWQIADGRAARGFVQLSSAGGQLDPRPDLPELLTIQDLEAQLSWRIEPAGSLHLWAPVVQLTTPDLTARLRGELCWHPSASPYVNAHLHLGKADARAVGRYLPVRILNPPLVAWLKRAIRSGTLTRGDVLWRGRLEDLPFDDQQGRLLIDLHIADGQLDYSAPRAGVEPKARWPALEDLDAEVRIVNRRLDITVHRGRFLDSEIEQGSAWLPNLWQAKRLFIEARGTGPFADGRRMLLDTPLNASLGRLAQAFEVEGRLGVGVRLEVPFRRGDPIDYQGALQWNQDAQARLRLGEGLDPVLLTGIAGQLDFSRHGVTAQDIQAQLGEQPLSIAVATLSGEDPSDQTARQTQIQVRGETPVAQLARSLPNPWWKAFAGDFDWTLAIRLANRDVSHAQMPLDLELRSDLRGLSLALPTPLGKSARATRPLALRARLLGSAWSQIEARYAPLQARLTFSADETSPPALRAAAIGLNAKPPPPPDTDGMRISGRLPELHLTPWLDWWRKEQSRLTNPNPRLPLVGSEIAVGRLVLGGLTLSDFEAQMAPDELGGIHIDFTATEQSGTLELPPAGESSPPRLELQQWQLGKPVTGDQPTVQAARTAMNPRHLGALEIRIDSLLWRHRPLGRFAVRVQPSDLGVDFQDLALNGSGFEVQGQGRWQQDRDGSVETAVTLKLDSPDAGQLLRDTGLYQGLDGSTASMEVALQWPGDPEAFALTKAHGQIDFEVGPGRLLDVEPGMARMLGMLNLAAIQRRLSLDFTDLTEDGFSFDQARGLVVIANALARIQSFELLSSSADIRLTGTANLATETLDQTLTVTPKVVSGVALASAAVGGPLVGAAVLLADKVAGDAVDRLSRHRYRVTGPWTQPRFELLGMSLGDSSEMTPAPEPRVQTDNLFLEHF